MDVTALRRLATARPHVLLLEEPGGAAARLAVEAFTRRAGWTLVDAPADADVLVLAGDDRGLAPFAQRVWDQLPGPRARVRAVGPADAERVLEEARRTLSDTTAQDADAHGRTTQRPEPGMPPAGGGDPHAGHDMGGHDMPADEPHAGHDMGGTGGHDMPADDPHAGHDMGGMEMPAGLAMADRADDRDGLKLDVLTVPLGPALPWWPAGLVVTTVLQGDVVQSAEVERLGTDGDRREGWRQALAPLNPRAAAVAVRLDALVRLLAVAGWEAARLQAQHLRDQAVAGVPLGALDGRLRRLARRVHRSRALERMSRGLRAGEPGVVERYRGWLDDVVAVLDGGSPPQTSAADAERLLGAALQGLEWGSARLVVAALDLELSGALAAEPAGV